MDKETLSNYGWIVICVLVLAVMIALATPFGTFVADGFKATYTGLFDTGDSALDVGLSAVGVTNTLECGHGRKESGDHAQLGCGHFACEDCGCVPASCGVDGHWSGDGKDHATIASCGIHEHTCECINGWNIPEGGQYTMQTAIGGKKIYSSGEMLPCEYQTKAGDKYTFGDYEYQYSSSGWRVYVLDKTKTEYGVILSHINSAPVTSLYQTFYGCNSIETAPAIPSTITDMSYAFWHCSTLKSAPDMTNANSVVNMRFAFNYCTSMVNAPVIPDSVTNMNNAFDSCYNLSELPEGFKIPSGATDITVVLHKCYLITGTIRVDANPTSYTNCFKDVDMSKITLIGDSTMKQTLANTGKNGSQVTIID